MPTYDYKCGTCGAVKEVVHSMAEMSAPSQETQTETTCFCRYRAATDWQCTAMHRIISQAPALGTIAGMSPSQRREVLKKRSHEHFKKEIAPVKEQMNKDFITKGREKFGLA
jgi:hypothetical protein